MMLGIIAGKGVCKGLIFGFVCAAFLLLAATPVCAVIIHGMLYDYALERVGQGIVEVSTYPIQRDVSSDGSYRFNVPPGNYTIRAQSFQEGILIANASEPIIVPEGSGEFNLDLILLPVMEQEHFSDDLNLSDLPNLIEQEKSKQWYEWALAILSGTVVLAAILIGWIWIKKWSAKTKKREPAGQQTERVIHPPVRSDIESIIQVIQNHEGRIIQRDLRKEIPFSEAKVSLIITELEHAGRITKIKKGRGNLLIIKE